MRVTFPALLAQANVIPVCGASLPGGPNGKGSRCKEQGLYTYASKGQRLHGDHEPPLTDAERQQPSVVMDPLRVQLLCAQCHALKTMDQKPMHATSRADAW